MSLSARRNARWRQDAGPRIFVRVVNEKVPKLRFRWTTAYSVVLVHLVVIVHICIVDVVVIIVVIVIVCVVVVVVDVVRNFFLKKRHNFAKLCTKFTFSLQQLYKFIVTLESNSLSCTIRQ